MCIRILVAFGCGHVTRAETVVERCDNPLPAPHCMRERTIESLSNCTVCLGGQMTTLDMMLRVYTHRMQTIYHSTLRELPSEEMEREFDSLNCRVIAINRRMDDVLEIGYAARRAVERQAGRDIPRERRRSPERMEAGVPPHDRPQGWGRRGAVSGPDSHSVHNARGVRTPRANRDSSDEDDEDDDEEPLPEMVIGPRPTSGRPS